MVACPLEYPTLANNSLAFPFMSWRLADLCFLDLLLSELCQLCVCVRSEVVLLIFLISGAELQGLLFAFRVYLQGTQCPLS